MLNRSRITLLLLSLGLAFHAYLTWHFYPVQFGFGAGEMQCNLNSTFNCDATTASPYSQIFGIPLSLFGAMTNVVMILLLLGAVWHVSENPDRSRRWAFHLSWIAAIASVVMAVISATLVNAYCLFCIFTYIAHIGAFVLLKKGHNISTFGADLKELVTAKGTLSLLLVVPAGAFLFHQALLNYYGGFEVKKLSQRTISEWKSNPQVLFDRSASLIKGMPAAGEAKMTIVEFADFRCGHCAKAAPAIKAFAAAYPDVEVRFFNFPLDGKCNPTINSGDGISCRIAKWVHCSGKEDSNKGWSVLDEAFAKQSAIASLRQESLIDESLGKIATQVGLSSENLLACVNSEETQAAITRQAKIGELAKVEGTPAIYVNGRKLPSGQVISVLKSVHAELTK